MTHTLTQRLDMTADDTAPLPLVPERDARPHLTLARVKEPAGLRARALLEGKEGVMLGSIYFVSPGTGFTFDTLMQPRTR